MTNNFTLRRFVGANLESDMDKMLMNPATSSVDTADNWAAGGYSEKDGLVEVVRNTEGEPGYDPSYGDWREP